MKQIVFFLLFLSVTSFFIASCVIPASKERYIANFERFVKDIEKNAENFKPKDWHWANKRYGLYSDEWYKKFSDELSLKEQLEIAALKIRFQAVRESKGIRRKYDQKIKEDLERLGDDVDKYLDENLEKDLDKLSKGAREIGDSAVKVVEDLMKELGNRKKTVPVE